MRKTLSIAVLILAFCNPAAAGIIHNPEPEPASVVQEPTTTGEDSTGAIETLTQIALDIVSNVLSLL